MEKLKLTVSQTYLLYYFVIIITFLIVNCSEKIRRSKYNKLSKIIFWFAILIPLIISANRYGIGTDYFNYVSRYYKITSENNIFLSIVNNGISEPGWIVLNYLVKYIFDDVKYVFVLSSIFILTFSFTAIYKYRYRINISIATFIFMCTMYNLSFNIIRQSLAMAIILFSIKYIEEKKPFKFLAIVFLAGSFHYSALIFIPLYWFFRTNKQNWGKVKRGILYLLFILLVFNFDTFFNFLVNLGGGVFSKYSAYELNDYSEIGFGNIIIRLPIIIIILLNIKRLKKIDAFMGEITSLYFISLILFFLAYMAPFIGRITMFFEMIQIFIVPAIIKAQNNTFAKYTLIIIILVYYILIFTNGIIIKNHGETIPYIFN